VKKVAKLYYTINIQFLQIIHFFKAVFERSVSRGNCFDKNLRK